MCQLAGQEKWTLFGISSFARGCHVVEIPKPQGFTRVVNCIDWIQNILDQDG